MPKEKVLILCTGNSCRSQMAEGVLRHFGGDKFEVYSAGTYPCYVNPTAIRVMDEIGIDISGHTSKGIGDLPVQAFDFVITVCSAADAFCPNFPGKTQKMHWPFPDPPHDQEVSEKTIQGFREVRDAILEKFKAAAENGFQS